MAIAIFTTWTTYGSWLPGDLRGWFKPGSGLQVPNPSRELEASIRMSGQPIILDLRQRSIVEKTIAEHCVHRNWHLHAVNCRSNHVHTVLTAPGRGIEEPREQFKAWCTRRLKEDQRLHTCEEGQAIRASWWTERGWDEYIDDELSLSNAVVYVRDGQ